jgi:hypothetical protein
MPLPKVVTLARSPGTHLLLLVGVRVDAAAVLCAKVVALAVKGSGVNAVEEEVNKLVIGHLQAAA